MRFYAVTCNYIGSESTTVLLFRSTTIGTKLSLCDKIEKFINALGLEMIEIHNIGWQEFNRTNCRKYIVEFELKEVKK